MDFETPPAHGERRIVVYTANLQITVVDLTRALDSAAEKTKQLGGYVQTRDDTSIVLRIPAAQFDAAIQSFETLGVVNSRHVDAADITEDYVDVEARIAAMQAVRDRLLKLLEKAEKTEAALAVEKELTRVNTELDSLKAKFELLKSRVAYSTVTLRFERVARTIEVNPTLKLPFPWLDALDLGRLLGQPAASPSKMYTSSWKG